MDGTKLILIGLIVRIGLTFAQEKEEPTATLAADTVDNGYVIAYGQLLKKPYYITLVNDTIFINGIPIAPPLQIPEPVNKIPAFKQTMLGKEVIPKTHEFQTNCGELYAKWSRKYGKEKALKMLETMLDTQRVVKIKKYRLGEGQLYIQYDYKYGDIYENCPVKDMYLDIMVELDSWLFANQKGGDKEDRLESVKRRNQFLFEEIMGGLEQGGLFYFDCTQTLEVAAWQAESIIIAIRNVIKATKPDSAKMNEISRLLMGIPLESAAEFLKNSETWEIINE